MNKSKVNCTYNLHKQVTQGVTHPKKWPKKEPKKLIQKVKAVFLNWAPNIPKKPSSKRSSGQPSGAHLSQVTTTKFSPQGQGRFIKIAAPSVCPTGGLFFFFFFLVPFKILLSCNSKQLLGTCHVFYCVFCALHHTLCSSFYWGAFVYCMLFDSASHRSV